MMMDNREEWLKARLKGIGASEAAAIVGQSPYMTNVELWELKTGRKQAVDISDKACVEYGKKSEEYLRELFKLDYPQYIVDYDEFGLVANCKECPFIFATLDGDLTENNRKGVLEIKTTEILNPSQWGKWDNQIPQNYFLQVLHQFIATGYDFTILNAQIKYHKNGEMIKTIRNYHIERSDVLDDIEYLKQEEIKFWQCVKDDRRPSLKLPQI
jgi:putative phage-type endonuclease